MAFVDDEDFERVMRYKWYYNNGYAVRSIEGGRKKLRLHRLILDAPNDMFVDHIDGNKLNNCKSNLRLCTKSENGKNVTVKKRGSSSRYKGVSWDDVRKKWKAYIKVDGKLIHLSYHVNEDDAGQAYNRAAKEHHKEFAHLNKISPKKCLTK